MDLTDLYADRRERDVLCRVAARKVWTSGGVSPSEGRHGDLNTKGCFAALSLQLPASNSNQHPARPHEGYCSRPVTVESPMYESDSGAYCLIALPSLLIRTHEQKSRSQASISRNLQGPSVGYNHAPDKQTNVHVVL